VPLIAAGNRATLRRRCRPLPDRRDCSPGRKFAVRCSTQQGETGAAACLTNPRPTMASRQYIVGSSRDNPASAGTLEGRFEFHHWSRSDAGIAVIVSCSCSKAGLLDRPIGSLATKLTLKRPWGKAGRPARRGLVARSVPDLERMRQVQPDRGPLDSSSAIWNDCRAGRCRPAGRGDGLHN
jgi:hypothetical protein